MERSFLDYAMSVIVSRALPDVRDGLKPVHRRIIWDMEEQGFRPDRPHVKCARVTGDTMAKYHPHGNSAIYDALVRMAQPFSLRHPLIDFHGNYGSPDFGPAAERYTECRLHPLGMQVVVTALPYQISVSSIAGRIQELVDGGDLDGIADVNDETSGKTGTRLVIKLKRDANANVVLNNLYKLTQLQTSFGVNMVAL